MLERKFGFDNNHKMYHKILTETLTAKLRQPTMIKIVFELWHDDVFSKYGDERFKRKWIRYEINIDIVKKERR